MSAPATRVAWFVHGPDAGCLRWSVVQAQRAFPEGTTFHVFADGRTGGLDSDAIEGLVAAGVEYGETDWDRGGNLNGLAAVRGILREMCLCAKSGEDVVWKLDADTLVGDPGVLLDWFEDPNMVGAGLRCPWAPGWWGISYALRAAVIAPLSNIIGSAGEAGLAAIGLSQAHEDLVISRMLVRYELSNRLRTRLTSRYGGAFMSYNHQGAQGPEDALRRFGIVTFGNRWQIEGSESAKRAAVAAAMERAVGGWNGPREWRTGATEALWHVGAGLRFGKSAVKAA